MFGLFIAILVFLYQWALSGRTPGEASAIAGGFLFWWSLIWLGVTVAMILSLVLLGAKLSQRVPDQFRPLTVPFQKLLGFLSLKLLLSPSMALWALGLILILGGSYQLRSSAEGGLLLELCWDSIIGGTLLNTLGTRGLQKRREFKMQASGSEFEFIESTGAAVSEAEAIKELEELEKAEKIEELRRLEELEQSENLETPPHTPEHSGSTPEGDEEPEVRFETGGVHAPIKDPMLGDESLVRTIRFAISRFLIKPRRSEGNFQLNFGPVKRLPILGIQVESEADRLQRKLHFFWSFAYFDQNQRIILGFLERQQVEPGDAPMMNNSERFPQAQLCGMQPASFCMQLMSSESDFGSWKKRLFDFQLPGKPFRKDLKETPLETRAHGDVSEAYGILPVSWRGGGRALGGTESIELPEMPAPLQCSIQAEEYSDGWCALGLRLKCEMDGVKRYHLFTCAGYSKEGKLLFAETTEILMDESGAAKNPFSKQVPPCLLQSIAFLEFRIFQSKQDVF